MLSRTNGEIKPVHKERKLLQTGIPTMAKKITGVIAVLVQVVLVLDLVLVLKS